MARRTPTMPISPTQLKHFAAATVALTALLAVFAGGEGIGVADQLKDRGSANQLAKTEVDKLGTKQLKADLKLKDGRKSDFNFSDQSDEADMEPGWGAGGAGGSAGGSAGGGSAVYSKPQAPRGSEGTESPKGPGQLRPGQSGEANNQGKDARKKAPPKPTQQDLDDMLEASRARSAGTRD